jgi:hypothetical protein
LLKTARRILPVGHGDGVGTSNWRATEKTTWVASGMVRFARRQSRPTQDCPAGQDRKDPNGPPLLSVSRLLVTFGKTQFHYTHPSAPIAQSSETTL